MFGKYFSDFWLTELLYKGSIVSDSETIFTMKLTCHVHSLNGSYTFVCFAHETMSEDDRLIEPEFYQKFCKGSVPQGNHFELELLQKEGSHPDVMPRHLHFSPTSKKHFVCWTGPLPTITMAKLLFRMWCVGNVYSFLTVEDFGHKFSGDVTDFLAQMKRDYCIDATVEEEGETK